MRKNRAMRPTVLVGIMVAIGFVVLLIAAIKGFEQYTIVSFWPATRGEVTKSQVTCVSDARSPTRYQPEIEFRYMAHGMELVSKTNANSNALDYSGARRVANSYSPGTHHVIRYDPSDPADIRADAGYTLDFFLWPVALAILGLAFILIPLWNFIAIQAPPERRDPKRAMRRMGTLFAMAGVGLILIGGWIGYSTRTMLKTWPVVDAQVMNIRTRSYIQRGKRRDITHFEVIVDFRYPAAGQEYLTPSAKDYTSSTAANQTLALYAPDSWHEIRYNPADPNEIRFKLDSGVWLGCYIFSGVGAFFTLFGGTFLMVFRLQRSKPPD